MVWDPCNVQRWKHKVGFHNRGVQWDTPMATWAGEGNDWIKLMAQRKPRKEDVIRSLLESMKQAVDEPHGTRPTKKPREVLPLELDIPEAGKRPTLETKSNCKTIVDWINGHAKLKTRECTVANTQNLVRDWSGRGVHLRQRTAVNTIKKLMRGLKRARRDRWLIGWTLPMSCGPRSSVSADFGMTVVTTVDVGLV